MRPLRIAGIVLAIACAAAVIPAVARLGGRTAAERPRQDTGNGEVLIVLTAGVFPTKQAAESKHASFAFTDVEGFQIVKTDGFADLTPGAWVLVSAFRTVAGADAFQPLAEAAGATVTRRIMRYTGSEYIGLGQEAHPDGTGPLNGPLPPGHPARIG